MTVSKKKEKKIPAEKFPQRLFKTSNRSPLLCQRRWHDSTLHMFIIPLKPNLKLCCINMKRLQKAFMHAFVNANKLKITPIYPFSVTFYPDTTPLGQEVMAEKVSKALISFLNAVIFKSLLKPSFKGVILRKEAAEKPNKVQPCLYFYVTKRADRWFQMQQLY